MIERMKLVSVMTTAERKTELLDKVREMGLLHIAERKAPAGVTVERFNSLSAGMSALAEYDDGSNTMNALLSLDDFEAMHKNVLETAERKKALEAQRNAALVAKDRISAWGDFSPAAFAELRGYGLDFHVYRLGKQELAALAADPETRFIRLAPVDKTDTVAVLGKLPPEIPASEFELPEKGISELDEEVAACDAGIADCAAALKKAAVNLPAYRTQLLEAQNAEEYSSAELSAESEEGLTWLTGYLPEGDAETFKATAKRWSWAYAMEDVVEDDEVVPTKVKYSKAGALMKPVFDILGTVPGYNEYDISFLFLLFFTLFFAMIIGDAAYGMLILILTIAVHVKTKKLSNAVLLLYVLSGATVVWGAVTGTWFGIKGAMNVPFLRALVIPGIANYPEMFNVATTAAQNNVMKFSFSLGLVQLSLACVMNIRKKLGKKDLSWVADLGWLMSIVSLYFLVLYLVVKQPVNLLPVACIVGLGFVLVLTFGGQGPGKSFGEGLKAGLGGAFTTFLDTISAFGNVMSYIRLFAVGMSGLAIAQSFNDMAAGLKGPLVVAAVVILVIGHALNLVMAFLSVAVHAVRLNLLEFSGQLGMEWSGKEYDPFRVLDRVRK